VATSWCALGQLAMFSPKGTTGEQYGSQAPSPQLELPVDGAGSPSSGGRFARWRGVEQRAIPVDLERHAELQCG